MIQPLAKYVGGKVLTAVLVVSAAIMLIWYYRLPDDARAALWATTRGILIWIGLVAVLPWATFFVPVRAVRAESNLISATVLAGYLAADIGVALALTRGTLGDGWQTVAMILGFLCAAVYNFVACDFIAGRAEDSL